MKTGDTSLGTPGNFFCRLPSRLVGHLIDETRHFRIIYIVDVNDREPGFNRSRDAGHTAGVGNRELHRQIAHIKRLLSQNQADYPVTQLLDSELSGVIGNHLYCTTQTGIHHGCTRTLGAKYVGAKHTGKVRNTL